MCGEFFAEPLVVRVVGQIDAGVVVGSIIRNFNALTRDTLRHDVRDISFSCQALSVRVLTSSSIVRWVRGELYTGL